jgi:hypothetical protein
MKKRKVPAEKLQELKDIAKLLAVEGVRNNTELEDLHAGIVPHSRIGDYSDVKVVTPCGEIEWSETSRISDEEMRYLMLSIERALEATLLSYESLGKKERQVLIEFIKTQRSYDCDDYSAPVN